VSFAIIFKGPALQLMSSKRYTKYKNHHLKSLNVSKSRGLWSQDSEKQPEVFPFSSSLLPLVSQTLRCRRKWQSRVELKLQQEP
jgi:hypothetical protein